MQSAVRTLANMRTELDGTMEVYHVCWSQVLKEHMLDLDNLMFMIARLSTAVESDICHLIKYWQQQWSP